MLLTIDIGNTNMNIGLFDGELLTMSARLATERQKTDDQFAVEFLNIFKIYNIDFNCIFGAVISSVVPEITVHVKNAVENCRWMLLVIHQEITMDYKITVKIASTNNKEITMLAVRLKSKA